MRSQSKIQCAVEETLATLYQVWGIQLAELPWGLSKPKNHTVHREIPHLCSISHGGDCIGVLLPGMGCLTNWERKV